MVDAAERRYLEDDDSSLMKTIKGATTGLVAGTIWGTVVATWYDVPRVERNVALPGLIRTIRMMGNYGLTFAAIGGVYIGVEQLVQNYRMKRDFFCFSEVSSLLSCHSIITSAFVMCNVGALPQ